MPDLRIQDQTIIVGDQAWDVEYPVLAAKLVDKLVLVITDYMAHPKHATARNLAAYSSVGERLWVAENPTSEGADAYVSFLGAPKDGAIHVHNFAGYDCTVRLSDGKLLEARFTK